MNKLPTVLVKYIYKFINRLDMLNMCCVSKTTSNNVYDNMITNEAGYNLYEEQISMYNSCISSIHRHNIINARMSAGKTAIMLMLALDIIERGGRVLIVIPSKVFSTWFKEMDKFRINIDKNPNKSEILIVHTKYPKHRDHKNKMLFRFILTTKYYINGLDIDTGLYILINDECHSGVTLHLVNYKKSMLFSASYEKNSKYTNRYNVNVISIKEQCTPGRDRYPNVALCKMRGESVNECISLMNSQKIVWMTDTKQTLLTKKFARIMESYSPEVKFFVFKTTTFSGLKDFNMYKKKCVLICSINSATEGTNFDKADTLIVQNFDILSLVRARQLVGRVRRKNNLNDTINMYTYASNIKSTSNIVRCRLNLIYSLNLTMEIFDKKPMQTINKILDSINIHVDKMTDEEILVLFTCRSKVPPLINLSKLTIDFDKLIPLMLI